MFILPELIIVIIMHTLATSEIKLSAKCRYILVGLNLLYGAVLVVSISTYLNISLDYLHGPLWLIPE